MKEILYLCARAPSTHHIPLTSLWKEPKKGLQQRNETCQELVLTFIDTASIMSVNENATTN